ncbi:MAG: endonuclease [Bacteroidetes bacterium]|nr:endonuclease [Bacteroidota bacterium]MBL6944601.1 endonuclease [Bacteroidales bacterium]
MAFEKHLLITSFFVSIILLNPVLAQIPAGYYDDTQGLTGDELKVALHNIIKDHIEFSYDDLRDFILKNTDEDPDNSNNVILLYTGRSQDKSTFGGDPNDWNREHVWAKSHGDFGNDPPAGTDAHHIRPTDVSVNSSRGNLDFDIGGSPVPEAPCCFKDGDSFEPRDAVKGDVARMIFYMATRYEGGDGVPDLEVVDAVNTYPNPQHGKLSQLILWNSQDPPDDFEMNRNDIIYYQYQNNRNPFIDHPEFVDAIWSDPSNIFSPNSLVISVYPNPAANQLYVSMSHAANSYYSIYSMLGNPVSNGSLLATLSNIDIRKLNSGIYFLAITNNFNQVTKKITFVKTAN